MSDDSQVPLAYPDHAAELQDIVRSVARLRRWSRFSVLWIVTACLCVFGAILFVGGRLDSPGDAVSNMSELTTRAVRAEREAAELRIEKDAAELAAEKVAAKLRGENTGLRGENTELRGENAKLRSEKEVAKLQSENAKLRRENAELKRVAVSRDLRDIRDFLGAGGFGAPLGWISMADPTGDASRLSPVLFKIQWAYMADLNRCYSEYLKKNPSARGKVSLSITVDETGRTVKGIAHGFASEVDDCITGQMASWQFPIFKNQYGKATDASFEIALQLMPVL